MNHTDLDPECVTFDPDKYRWVKPGSRCYICRPDAPKTAREVAEAIESLRAATDELNAASRAIQQISPDDLVRVVRGREVAR